MERKSPLHRRRWVGLILVTAMSVGLAAKAGRFLVMDAPRPSDVILVLAGGRP